MVVSKVSFNAVNSMQYVYVLCNSVQYVYVQCMYVVCGVCLWYGIVHYMNDIRFIIWTIVFRNIAF